MGLDLEYIYIYIYIYIYTQGKMNNMELRQSTARLPNGYLKPKWLRWQTSCQQLVASIQDSITRLKLFDVMNFVWFRKLMLTQTLNVDFCLCWFMLVDVGGCCLLLLVMNVMLVDISFILILTPMCTWNQAGLGWILMDVDGIILMLMMFILIVMDCDVFRLYYSLDFMELDRC